MLNENFAIKHYHNNRLYPCDISCEHITAKNNKPKEFCYKALPLSNMQSVLKDLFSQRHSSCYRWIKPVVLRLKQHNTVIHQANTNAAKIAAIYSKNLQQYNSFVALMFTCFWSLCIAALLLQPSWPGFGLYYKKRQEVELCNDMKQLLRVPDDV